MIRQARRDRGFTLAEVLVTIVVVGTALVVLTQGIALGVRADARAERHTMAAMVLNETVARLETGEISLTENSDGEFEQIAPGYHYRVELETPGDPPDLTYASITIGWGADDRGRNPAGELFAARWFYRGESDEEGGVTRGPQVGSAEQGGGR